MDLRDTQEQKARHLEKILSTEEIWCQGFSEPGAGSDLSAVRTSARLNGDSFIVNGQKVWSSFAHIADWCILVTRSDPESQRHAGLTYMIVDMHAPGVDVRPLRQITGEAEFNEIFFNDVEVPKENVLGAIGGGWQVAMTTLLHERGTLGFALTAGLESQLGKLIELAKERGTSAVRRLLAAPAAPESRQHDRGRNVGDPAQHHRRAGTRATAQPLMDFSFTREQDELRREARGFLETNPEAPLAELRELGWLGVSVPEDRGGGGLSFIEEAILFEEAGRTLYSGPFLTTAVVLPALEEVDERAWSLELDGLVPYLAEVDLVLTDELDVFPADGVVLQTMDESRPLGRLERDAPADHPLL